MKTYFKNQIDGMLLATFITQIFYSATYPFIHKTIMLYATDTIIAINQIVNCLSIVIFGSLWNRKGIKLFKHYRFYCILECISTFGASLYVITTNNIFGYYVLDTIAFSFITRQIICGGIKLRAMRYKSEESRERFDNNNNSAASIATIIGSLIAVFLKLDFKVMIMIATVGNCIDNIFYIFIYKKTINEQRNKKVCRNL